MALSALSHAASHLNRGESPTIRASYGYVFRHFLRHIGVLFFQSLFGGIIPFCSSSTKSTTCTRAALSLMRVAQAAAALEDHSYLVPDDVKRVLPPVLRHRIASNQKRNLKASTPIASSPIFLQVFPFRALRSPTCAYTVRA
ncbi:hypothetical protein [Acidicapsa acidisoli]|uniref:hypothetical protein n=1 Tax=Acidicapsa acidisoli TaxID=1615681 RepID=UPI0021E081EB|nr:hypothetical protein [Acidicapsa acidisoli]